MMPVIGHATISLCSVGVSLCLVCRRISLKEEPHFCANVCTCVGFSVA